MPSFVKRLRGWNEKFGTVQSVLKNLGLWPFISALIIAAAISVGTYLKHLQWPEVFVLGLITLTCCVLLAVLVPEFLRPRLKVKLTPINVPSPIQLLTVENSGPQQIFCADCTLIKSGLTFCMEWEYRDVRTSGKLPHGRHRNLIIAVAGETRGINHGHPYEMKWIAITGLSVDGQREEKQRSTWSHGDKLPECDIKITITSGNRKPHIECFTVRTGRNSALEMVPLSCNGSMHFTQGSSKPV